MNVIDNNQFKIIQELLDRQDSALDQLDSLNNQVEAAITDVTQVREKETGDDGAEPRESANIASVASENNGVAVPQDSLSSISENSDDISDNAA